MRKHLWLKQILQQKITAECAAKIDSIFESLIEHTKIKQDEVLTRRN